MAAETFTITHEKTGQAVTANGEVVRYDDAARVRRATVRAVGGLVLGAVSILVPVLHFFSTWGLPLLGFFLAFKAYTTRAVVKPLSCTCPACQAEVTVDGAALGGPMLTMCPKCMENLELSQPESTSA
jgi:Mg/Co/Ni transporter MgtE